MPKTTSRLTSASRRRPCGAALRGHATNPPGRWKEPGAFPATDHERNAPARGAVGTHPSSCPGAVWRAGPDLGSVIPHAGTVGLLVIAMIEAAFRAYADGAGARCGLTRDGLAVRHAGEHGGLAGRPPPRQPVSKGHRAELRVLG